MSAVKVKALQEPYSCEVTNGQYTFMADTTVDNGGQNKGFRPHDLLASALGSCTSIWIRKYAKEHQLPLESVSVDVELDRSQPDKVIFNKTISLKGNLSEQEREKLYKVAETCPVQRTLGKKLVFETKSL